MKLWKTTIVIYTPADSPDPSATMELASLAREATEGGSYCSVSRSEIVEDAEADPDWDGTEFFFGQAGADL